MSPADPPHVRRNGSARPLDGGMMFSVSVISAALLLSVLAPIAVIDSRRLIIPDGLNLLLLAGGTALATSVDNRAFVTVALEVAATAAIVLLFREAYYRLRGAVGLGLGDVKFLAASAAWVGIGQIPWLVLIASCSGLTVVVLRAGLGLKPDAGSRIAFGPHLCLGLLIVFILQPAYLQETSP